MAFLKNILEIFLAYAVSWTLIALFFFFQNYGSKRNPAGFQNLIILINLKIITCE